MTNIAKAYTFMYFGEVEAEDLAGSTDAIVHHEPIIHTVCDTRQQAIGQSMALLIEDWRTSIKEQNEEYEREGQIPSDERIGILEFQFRDPYDQPYSEGGYYYQANNWDDKGRVHIIELDVKGREMPVVKMLKTGHPWMGYIDFREHKAIPGELQHHQTVTGRMSSNFPPEGISGRQLPTSVIEQIKNVIAGKASSVHLDFRELNKVIPGELRKGLEQLEKNAEAMTGRVAKVLIGRANDMAGFQRDPMKFGVIIGMEEGDLLLPVHELDLLMRAGVIEGTSAKTARMASFKLLPPHDQTCHLAEDIRVMLQVLREPPHRKVDILDVLMGDGSAAPPPPLTNEQLNERLFRGGIVKGFTAKDEKDKGLITNVEIVDLLLRHEVILPTYGPKENGMSVFKLTGDPQNFTKRETLMKWLRKAEEDEGPDVYENAGDWFDVWKLDILNGVKIPTGKYVHAVTTDALSHIIGVDARFIDDYLDGGKWITTDDHVPEGEESIDILVLREDEDPWKALGLMKLENRPRLPDDGHFTRDYEHQSTPAPKLYDVWKTDGNYRKMHKIYSAFTERQVSDQFQVNDVEGVIEQFGRLDTDYTIPDTKDPIDVVIVERDDDPDKYADPEQDDKYGQATKAIDYYKKNWKRRDA